MKLVESSWMIHLVIIMTTMVVVVVMGNEDELFKPVQEPDDRFSTRPTYISKDTLRLLPKGVRASFVPKASNTFTIAGVSEDANHVHRIAPNSIVPEMRFREKRTKDRGVATPIHPESVHHDSDEDDGKKLNHDEDNFHHHHADNDEGVDNEVDDDKDDSGELRDREEDSHDAARDDKENNDDEMDAASGGNGKNNDDLDSSTTRNLRSNVNNDANVGGGGPGYGADRSNNQMPQQPMPVQAFNPFQEGRGDPSNANYGALPNVYMSAYMQGVPPPAANSMRFAAGQQQQQRGAQSNGAYQGGGVGVPMATPPLYVPNDNFGYDNAAAPNPQSRVQQHQQNDDMPGMPSIPNASMPAPQHHFSSPGEPRFAQLPPQEQTQLGQVEQRYEQSVAQSDTRAPLPGAVMRARAARASRRRQLDGRDGGHDQEMQRLRFMQTQAQQRQGSSFTSSMPSQSSLPPPPPNMMGGAGGGGPPAMPNFNGMGGMPPMSAPSMQSNAVPPPPGGGGAPQVFQDAQKLPPPPSPYADPALLIEEKGTVRAHVENRLPVMSRSNGQKSGAAYGDDNVPALHEFDKLSNTLQNEERQSAASAGIFAGERNAPSPYSGGDMADMAAQQQLPGMSGGAGMSLLESQAQTQAESQLSMHAPRMIENKVTPNRRDPTVPPPPPMASAPALGDVNSSGQVRVVNHEPVTNEVFG